MNIPKELRYAETHEWVRVEGNRAFVGITDYAQESLGDIVFVEMPKPGRAVKKGEEVATIESVKAASAIYSPLSGTIAAVNPSLEKAPESINKDPYQAFLFTLEIGDPQELARLLDAQGYEQVVEREKGSHT